MPSKRPLNSGRNWYQTAATARRRAWLLCPEVEAVLVIGQFDNPDDPDQKDHEATVSGYEPVLLQFRQGPRYVSIDLSLMTMEEIDALKTLLELAIERGSLVSAKLDERAQTILESGEVIVPMRAFRMKPTLVVRHLEIGGIDNEEA